AQFPSHNSEVALSRQLSAVSFGNVSRGARAPILFHKLSAISSLSRQLQETAPRRTVANLFARSHNSRLTSQDSSKRLTDAEVNAPGARLGLTVHEQAWNRIELVAHIQTHRTDG